MDVRASTAGARTVRAAHDGSRRDYSRLIARSREARNRGVMPTLDCVGWKNLSHAMVEEALRKTAERDPKRKNKLKSDYINNVANVVDLFQRWAHSQGSGQGYATLFEIAQALYGPDKIRTRDDADRLSKSIWRWVKKPYGARDAGLVDLEQVFGANGESKCVRWSLLDPTVDSILAADVAQLARATPRCELRRRRETKRQREAHRHRPYARRTGRQGVPRLVRRDRARPGPLSFSSQKSARSSRPPLPYGKEGDVLHSGGRARGALSRRERAEQSDKAQAALAARQSLGLARSPAELLAELPWLAEMSPVDLARAALAVYQPRIAPRLSARWQRRLEAAVRRIDRYADAGRGRKGLGCAMLLELCIDPEPPWRGARRPRSLGGIVIPLHRISRKWRADEKARRRRRAEGRPS